MPAGGDRSWHVARCPISLASHADWTRTGQLRHCTAFTRTVGPVTGSYEGQINALSIFVQQQSEFDDTRDVRIFVACHLFSVGSRFRNVALNIFEYSRWFDYSERLTLRSRQLPEIV